jgi:hypothetical protein
MYKRIATAFVLFIAAFGALETGASLISTGRLGLGLPAEAIVGRPLTPVSVAGVTRRTVRRCAAGVYNC